MTRVRFHQPENRLAAMIDEPGGRTIARALKEARSNIDSVSELSRLEVDRLIKRLDELAELAVIEGDGSKRHELYAVANVIAGLGGSCGLAGVGDAAFSLCDLTDQFLAAGRWDARTVHVHLDALRVLRRDDTDRVRGAVLEGLRLLVQNERAKSL